MAHPRYTFQSVSPPPAAQTPGALGPRRVSPAGSAAALSEQHTTYIHTEIFSTHLLTNEIVGISRNASFVGLPSAIVSSASKPPPLVSLHYLPNRANDDHFKQHQVCREALICVALHGSMNVVHATEAVCHPPACVRFPLCHVSDSRLSIASSFVKLVPPGISNLGDGCVVYHAPNSCLLR